MVVRVLLVLWLINLSQVASDTSDAFPGCQKYCGSVAIKYPFGVGENCYFNQWFEIDCKKHNTPYIKSIGLRVANFSIESSGLRGASFSINRLQVFVPLNFSNYGGGISSYDLRGTPFSFSKWGNSFVGMGCNIIAYTSDRDYDNTVWCSNICNSNNSKDYCEAELQQNINTLEPIILSAVSNTLIMSNSTKLDQKDASGFGFLADQSWLYDNRYYSTERDYMYTYFNYTRKSFGDKVENVPVNLDWELLNATPALFGVNNVTTYCETKEPWFQSNNSFYNNRSTFKCSCRLNYIGNPYLPNGCVYLAPESDQHHFKLSPVIIGACSAIGALVVVLFIWGSYKVVKREINRRKKEKYFKRNGGLFLQQQILSSDGNIEKIKVFSSYELEKATDYFNVDRVLGQGGQGTVYKGMLSDGRIVAVKKSKLVDTANVSQFINEVVILSQINHRNVVKLLGCCLETEVPLLVYEFIINGTLFQHIHNPNEDFSLTWEIRLRIGAEIAGAISYMHSAASLPIYHRDIKSTNILLDDKYKAKVSDFGTSKSVDVDKTHFTTLVQGTFGYLDPEYFRSSQFTEKSDVYSFGVVLVELLTGRKPIFSNTSHEVKGLAPHFIELMEQNQLLDMIDPQISEKGKMEEIVAVAHLAKMCLNLNGKRRPTMKEVAMQLEGIRMSRRKIATLDNYEVVEDYGTVLAEGFDASSTSTWSWC